MKVNSKIKLYATVGLTLGLVVGCGGGSGSDEPASTLVTLSPETSEIMAKNVSEALPGCTYSSLDAATIPSEEVALRLYKATIDNILDKKTNQSARVASARDVNEVYQGDCATPGSYTIIGTHDDGVDDLTYTFNSFCTMSEDGSSTIDGTLSVKNIGIPSDLGPIPQSSSVSTGTGGLQIAEKTTEGTFNHSANINDFMFTYGNGEEEATAASPDIMKIGSLVIVDGRENSEFNVSNVDLTSYTSGLNNVLQISSISFTDPETGTVSISSTPLEIDENGVLLTGSVMASGGEGTEMVLNKTTTVDNAFDVMVDGTKLGVMNCTDF